MVRLSAFQVFALFFLVPFGILAIGAFLDLRYAGPVLAAAAMVGTYYGWMLNAGVFLHQALTGQDPKNLRLFKQILSGVFVTGFIIQPLLKSLFPGELLFFHSFLRLCLLIGFIVSINFVAENLGKVEEQKFGKKPDRFRDFVMAWLLPIGIWSLQRAAPTVNQKLRNPFFVPRGRRKLRDPNVPMKKVLAFFLTAFVIAAYGQNADDEAAEIVAEGKALYRLEMTSWQGTDLLLQKYFEGSGISGYFSYTDGDSSRCVFFTPAGKAAVVISFDSTFNDSAARVDLQVREFTPYENDLFVIRQQAVTVSQTDPLFKVYQNTSLNFIPVITGGKKKVYVLTGPKQGGVVIFGNDFLLTFDRENNLVEKKALHKNIIPIYYEEGNTGRDEQTMHTHSEESGELITATDICTLMLYEKFAGWKTHQVVSRKYISLWDCATDQLVIMKKDALDRIYKSADRKRK